MSHPESSASVGSVYDRWAASYDTDVNRTRDLDASVARLRAPNVTDRDVLELGPGTGKNTRWLAKKAHSVIGLDASPGMLAIARERLIADGTSDKVELLHYDIANRWPLADESVDVVIADLVLEHIQGVAHVFAEAARVLRLDGSAFVCELHPIRQFLGGRAHFVDPGTKAVVDVPVFRHTVSEFVNAGIAAGLVIERMDDWFDADRTDAPPRLLSVLFRKR